MKVNNIQGANLNFTRAIKISSNTNPYGLKGGIDNATMSVINTISGKNSVYDKETSAKIGEFLRAVIGDYSPESGIIAKKIDGQYYIFTGKEARMARAIQKKAFKKRQKLIETYEKGPTPDMPRSEQVRFTDRRLQKILEQNIFLDKNKQLLQMVESGQGKNQTDTRLDFKIGKDEKLKRAEYHSYRNDGRTGSVITKTLTV